jgi:hypothetical protein
MAAVLRGSRNWSPKQYSVSSNEEEENEDDEHLDAEDAIISPNAEDTNNFGEDEEEDLGNLRGEDYGSSGEDIATHV